MNAVPEPQPRTFPQDEQFHRDLNEVYLLIDFVSGRVDKSLSGLVGASDMDADGNPVKDISPQKVVEEICKVRYPPTGTMQANAQQAAFILVVKDKLNYLAAPARGLTVAFTSMFAGVSLQYPNRLFRAVGAILVWLKIVPPLPPALDKDFAARVAYPNLESQARRFRRFYDWLPIYALLLALLIAVTNWDVNVTNSALQKINEANKAYTDLFADKAFAPTLDACRKPLSKPMELKACATAADLRSTLDDSRAVLRDLVSGDYLSYLRPVALSVRIFGGTQYFSPSYATGAPSPMKSSATQGALESKLEILIAAVIAGLSNILIPAAFAGLGTLAGLLRSITSKVYGSVLAPRDFGIARASIFLGMSAGLAVGLFDLGTAASKADGSPISISAAGLSFLAGFAAEAFFTFLDGLILRLIPAWQTPVGAPVRTHPAERS